MKSKGRKERNEKERKGKERKERKKEVLQSLNSPGVIVTIVPSSLPNAV